MYRKTDITLISYEITRDDVGNAVRKESLHDTYARVSSVSQSEFSSAGQMGIKPEYRITVNTYDYSGEKIVVLFGEKYAVYRTYQATPFEIELYVERKEGVDG